MEKMVKGCARRLFETPKQMDQMESRWSAHRGVGFARGPPPAFFWRFLFVDRNCGRALKIAHTTTSKQGSPALALAQGGAGARITAQSEEGRGGGCSQGSSELDSERRRVQCALQGKAMDRHIPSSSGSSWLTASSIMPLSFLSRSYHRVDLLRVNIGNAIMDLVNSNERRRCHDCCHHHRNHTHNTHLA